MFAGAIRTSSTATSFRNRAGNCLLITVAVICVCILVTCGVMIVTEYVLGKGYSPTTCKVENVTADFKNLLSCQFCDTKKKKKGSCERSWFPCAQIIVNYTLHGRTVKGILHPDSLQAIGQFHKCSYEVCLRTEEENVRKVKEFRDKWNKRKGQQEFKCFYNEEDTKSLIEYKKHTKNEVIHSMLWPSVVILICGAIFLKLEMDRRKLTCCGVQEGNNMNKSNQRGNGGRTCNGKNDLFPTSVNKSGPPLHRSLEHLSNYSTNKPDYHSTSSKSLSCLDHVGVNGHSSNNKVTAKHHLLQHPAQLQASCSETGTIKNKVLKSSSDQNQCLIPEITINDFGTSESLKSHHETPV